MEVDDKIISYEINKYLPKSTPKETEKADEKQLPDQQKAEREDRPGQDTVVNISQASKEAQRINEIISSEPDVREDKVSALKDKIESGRYEIDHEGVAEKLVDAFIDEVF